MPLSEFRTAYSWQEAIDLGPSLVRLSEELPALEQMGLAWQLQQVMVDLPAAIAVDLMEDGSNTRRAVAVKLMAALDLIDKIYPALDTAEVRSAVEALVERIKSERFSETAGGIMAPSPVPPPMGPGVPASSVPVFPEPAASPDPTSAAQVPIIAEPQMAPVMAPPAPVQVAVQAQESVSPAEESHVQPDSVQ
jgi:hypothetical protein